MAELDKIRTELLNRSAITLQRHARGFVKRSQYQRKRHAIVVLQACLCCSQCSPWLSLMPESATAGSAVATLILAKPAGSPSMVALAGLRLAWIDVMQCWSVLRLLVP